MGNARIAAQAANLRCTMLCRDDSSSMPISMVWLAMSRMPARSSICRVTWICTSRKYGRMFLSMNGKFKRCSSSLISTIGAT
ncbi:hypothetical protein D3C71_1846680 [compost metagenome]